MSNDNLLYMFEGKQKPDPIVGYHFYQQGLDFKNRIQLFDNVRVNENFFVGKQWEGVESNGLPTPQINILKRVVGFIVATITSDNIHVNASALANTVGTSGYKDIVNIINDEFEAVVEQNRLPALIREFARNAAVDGDGCLYTYWDADAETGQKAKGRIKTEVVENTRVFFGDPNDREVQSQPYIILVKRESVRRVRRRAKDNGIKEWMQIKPDDDATEAQDEVKWTDDKCTTMLMFWKAEDDIEDFCEVGDVCCYEYTADASVKEPWNIGIKMYPFSWLNWDYVQDSYHGQAMITGLIPNQVFINKSWAMTMVSIMKAAFSKVIYDATRIKQWDNRVGGAIPVNGGDVNSVARTIDPAPISPQVSQYIQLAVEQTEQSLGATSVALGDTRPDNTSAIIALQRAAATPSEMTKQNIYDSVEELFRIYLEFMGEYYGKRYVDVPPTQQELDAVTFAQEFNPDVEVPDEVPVLFDFKELKKHPVSIKLDVGASTYYSEIAAIQTMDNLLRQGLIGIDDYLERIPDDYIPGRRALLEKKKQEIKQQQMAMQAMQEEAEMGGMPMGGGGGDVTDQGVKPNVPSGRGYGGLQRAINQAGDTKGLV